MRQRLNKPNSAGALRRSRKASLPFMVHRRDTQQPRTHERKPARGPGKLPLFLKSMEISQMRYLTGNLPYGIYEPLSYTDVFQLGKL